MAGTIAENWAFVLFAYLTVFFTWAAVSTHDYISSTWRTLNETRKNGLAHLGLLLLPMSYMFTYIYFQAKAKQYTEMSAAIVAVLFAWIDFFRTVVGLWQLHIHRQWLVSSIRSLESLGYTATGNEESKKLQKKMTRMTTAGWFSWAYAVADGVKVNESIVENRFTEGDVKCYLRWRFSISETAEGVSRSKAYTSPKSFAHLQPHQPEEVWMRWACVLVSQIFPEWLEDMKESTLAMDGGSNADFSTRRAKFAMEVLLSASMHTQRPRQSGPVSEQQEHGSNSGGAECNYRNQSSHSFLKFNEWDKYKKLCQGAFSKQEFLRVACSTGDGLPFGIRHTKSENEKGERSLYSYSNLATKLERYRESFPVEDFEKLERFDASILEWLAIFLSVLNWRTEETSGRAADEDSSEESAGTSFALQSLSSQLGIGTILDGETGMGSLGIGSFPLLQSSWKRCLWRNRNIMEASLHIDNFLAFCVGSQYSFMLEKESETRKRLFQAAQAVDPNVDDAEYGPPSFRSQPTTWDANALVENERLMYQFAHIQPEFAFLEQGMTFIGCSMECLRSSLARWVARNPSTQEQAWRKTILQSDSSSTQLQSTPFKFRTSKSFASCVPNLLNNERFEERYVQMRLIWELQNYFHQLLPAEGVSPDRAEAIILCILSFPALQVAVDSGNVEQISGAESVANVEGGCAISIGPETPSTSATEEVHLAVRVPCAPQHVSVQILLQRTAGDAGVRASAAVGIDCSQGEISFAWELWRNAFNARLEMVRQWQKKHELPWLGLVRTTNGIGEGIGRAHTERTGTGEGMDVWLGWLPHRVSICMFELESTGFILRRKKEEYAVPHEFLTYEVHDMGILKEIQVCISYERASLSELEHASAVAREILDKIAKCGSEFGRIVKITGEDILQKAEEIAKSPKENGELVTNLYEAVGVQMNSITVLEKVVELLLRGESTAAKTRRAVEMIECFCAFTGVAKKVAQFGCASLRFEDEHVAEDILRLIENILAKVEDRSIVVRSAARICTSFENFETADHREKLSVALGASVLRYSSSEDRQEIPGLKAILGSIISSNRTGVNTLPFLLVSEFVETRDENPDRTELAAKLVLGSNVPPSVPLAITILNVAFQESRGRTEQWGALNMLGVLFRIGAKGLEVNAVRAVELHERAIREGNDIDAMNRLANLLRYGAADVEVNAVRAVELYERAIREGNDTDAMYNLALLLVDGAADVEVNAVRAVGLYVRAIHEGNHIWAMVNLANLLRDGAADVEVNAVLAVELYETAIHEGNHIWAMVSLANLLRDGAADVEVNAVRAVELYETAICEGNDTDAMNDLANLLKDGAEDVEVNAVRAVELYERAIREGNHIWAMVNLANLLKNGAADVEVNAVRAMELYERAIREGNHIDAMNDLANLLKEGAADVEVNTVQAVELYERAIREGNHIWAMHNLARLLTDGTASVEMNAPRAVDLLQRCAHSSAHSRAMNTLGLLLENGRPYVESDAAQAARVYSSAILSDDDRVAKFNLAVLLTYDAVGVPRDIPRAVQLYEELLENKAAEFMAGLVANNLGVLLQLGADDVPVKCARAAQLYRRASDNGDHSAGLYNLAVLVRRGFDGVPADANAASDLYMRAIRAGGPVCSDNFGEYLCSNNSYQSEGPRSADALRYTVAIETFDDVRAMNNLAALLQNGAEGVAADPPSAKRLYARAVWEGAHVGAMENLARLLETGAEGVPADPEFAEEMRARAREFLS